MAFRKVGSITEDEWLGALTTTPQTQLSIFVRLGGDPNDHNYARLSFLTAALRRRGVRVLSSRSKGVWLAEEEEAA